jgi:Spy/CpxP family protein refolding chaperone
MKPLYKLAVATLLVAAPSLSFAQGKAPHPTPVDKSDRISYKIERSELKFAHDQKLLTKGIRLTSTEKKQMKAIEKKYDADYRDLLKKAKASEKNGTVGASHQGAKTVPQPYSDATFRSQLSQLQTQERADVRAVLTPQQQSVFDSNVSKLST